MYIVASVEFDGEVYQFAYRKRGAGNVIASSIDTIGTVIDTIIGQHYFQQGYATTVLGEAMAYPPAAYGVSQCAGLVTAHGPTTRAGNIIFSRFCEYFQFGIHLIRIFLPKIQIVFGMGKRFGILSVNF